MTKHDMIRRAACCAGLCLSLVLIVGCEEETPLEAQREANEDKPSGNSLISVERMYSKLSIVSQLSGNNSGSAYFWGFKGESCTIGKLNPGGSLSWTEGVPFLARDLYRVPSSTGVISNGVMAVGLSESQSKKSSLDARISIFTADGALAGETVYSIAGVDLWFRSLTIAPHSSYVAVGGAEIDNVRYPFVAMFSVTPDGEISEPEAKVLTELPNVWFTEIEIDPGYNPGATEASYFLTGYRCGTSEPVQAITAHKIRATGTDVALDWSVDLTVFDGLDTWPCNGENLVLSNGNLYIVGATQVVKPKAPGDGGLWVAGLVASVSSAGQLNWIKSVYLSRFADRYFSCFAKDGVLYAVGNYSSFVYPDSKRTFGYGLLSKFDLDTGDAFAHMSFGSDRYASGFSTAFPGTGTTLHIGGWTREFKSDGSYDGWYAEISAGNRPGSLLAEPPAVSSARAFRPRESRRWVDVGHQP